jgi:hypothetical protein
MKTPIRVALLSTVMLWLIMAALPASAATEPTGPDSFLPWRAYTVNDLVTQVENNDVVRQRLAKHFHVSQAELVSYLRDNVKVVAFSESGWRPVYGVDRTGRIYRARDYFHRGGKVFGTADGKPLLKYACGNPLVTTLPRKKPVPVARPRVEMRPPVAPPPIQYSEVVPTPLAPIPEAPAPIQSPEEYALAVAPPVAPPIEVPPAIVESSRGGFPLWPLAGGFIPFLIHHDEPTPPPPIIPEPSGLLLFASGLALVGGILLRRRR